jgi:two-component system, chemotaxis family, response regulator Rcp1
VVIEDNKADVFLVEEAMAVHEIHAELQVITDGEEAMRRIEAPRGTATAIPDLFILDLNLPKRSGNEILAGIRRSAQYAHVPVLIMTSSEAEKDRQETTRLGSSGYFRKPSGLDEFLKIGAVIKSLMAGEDREA